MRLLAWIAYHSWELALLYLLIGTPLLWYATAYGV
jgi:hypothetical protein